MFSIVILIILILIILCNKNDNEYFLSLDKQDNVYNFHSFNNKDIEKYNNWCSKYKEPKNYISTHGQESEKFQRCRERSSGLKKIENIPLKTQSSIRTKQGIEKFSPESKFKTLNNSYSKKDIEIENYEPIQFYVEDDEDYNLEPYIQNRDIDYYFVNNDEVKTNNDKDCSQNYNLKIDPFKIGLLPMKCPDLK